MMVCSVLQEYCNINENLSISLSFLFPTVSLTPSSCASFSSSPCNSPLLSLCSPYNQVFFKLFCKVSYGSVPRPSSVLLFSSHHLLTYFSFTFYISKVKTWWNVSLSRWHCYLWSIEIHSSGLYVLAGTECQFNKLLYTLGPLLLGSLEKVNATDYIFLHYTDLTSFCVWKRQRICLTLIYASLSVTVGFVL